MSAPAPIGCVADHTDRCNLTNVITEAIKELRAELVKADGGSLEHASADDLERAKTFGFPRVLLEFYGESAPEAGSGVVQLDQRIWSVRNAIIENRDYVPGAYLFPLGYTVFASTTFGDAYCIDTVHAHADECPVVLFPHDVIGENCSLEDVEQYRLAVACNLEDFLRQFTLRTLIQKPRYR